MATLLIGLIIGTLAPQWGHTWITQGNDKIYALRSLAEGSSLLVFEYSCEDDGICGPVFFTDNTKLKLIGEYKTEGKHSCHITLLKRQAIVADYTSGTMSIFELDENGIPKADAKLFSFPHKILNENMNRERQSSSYIHSSWISPDKQSLIVVDLGFDRLYRYRISDGRISEKYDILNLPDGCGPRHCAFGNDRLYISTELSDEVLTYSWPEMKLLQRNLANETKPGGGSHIAMRPDNKFLYASCRLKNDGIAIFKVDENGTLAKVGYQNTGGHPRHFSISEDGKHLAVGCRDNDIIEVFTINENTGLLTKESEYNIEKPVYVNFIK